MDQEWELLSRSSSPNPLASSFPGTPIDSPARQRPRSWQNCRQFQVQDAFHESGAHDNALDSENASHLSEAGAGSLTDLSTVAFSGNDITSCARIDHTEVQSSGSQHAGSGDEEGSYINLGSKNARVILLDLRVHGDHVRVHMRWKRIGIASSVTSSCRNEGANLSNEADDPNSGSSNSEASGAENVENPLRQEDTRSAGPVLGSQENEGPLHSQCSEGLRTKGCQGELTSKVLATVDSQGQRQVMEQSWDTRETRDGPPEEEEGHRKKSVGHIDKHGSKGRRGPFWLVPWRFVASFPLFPVVLSTLICCIAAHQVLKQKHGSHTSSPISCSDGTSSTSKGR